MILILNLHVIHGIHLTLKHDLHTIPENYVTLMLDPSELTIHMRHFLIKLTIHRDLHVIQLMHHMDIHQIHLTFHGELRLIQLISHLHLQMIQLTCHFDLNMLSDIVCGSPDQSRKHGSGSLYHDPSNIKPTAGVQRNMCSRPSLSR